jgi:arylsulfatase A-like enzyme
VQTWERPLIAPDRLTIGKLAQQHGYRTACIGKWHLGWDWPIPPRDRRLFVFPKDRRSEWPATSDQQRSAWQAAFAQPIGGGPVTRGFDEYFGTDVPNWPPYCFIEDDRTVGLPSRLLPAELLTGKLARVQGPAVEGWNLESILPALADRAVKFVSRQAKAQQPFLLYLPLTSPHTPLAVADEWKGKSGLDHPVADFIMQTDHVVGQVMAALESSGVADNTLVIFSSDNGSAPFAGVRRLEAKGHFPSGPLRGYKADAWEGGHRIPFIVRWPGVVEAGRVSDNLVHQADVMATAADILKLKLPANAGEDSFSLLPLLRGDDIAVREHAVSQSASGVFAVRHKQWKLIAGPVGRGPSATAAGQLYNLANDVPETTNLYAEQPRVVAELTALLGRLVADGRSTAGPRGENDVPVNWRRFLYTQASADKHTR